MLDTATIKALAAIPREWLMRHLVTPEIEALMERMPKPVGSFGYDPWGYHEEGAKLGLALGKRLYDHYFRVVSHGLEHVPAQGRVLLIANHAGQLPMDGVMIGVALATNPHGPRALRAMIERFLPTVPWIAPLLTSWGAVIGDPLNCAKLLERDEAVLVFPEGVRGSGKPYHQRYQLQRFGNGFLHLAIEHRAPIVPVGVVGSEETMPSLGNIGPLARLLGIPYFPILPVYLPLPARMVLNFGAPIVFEGPAGSEDEVNEQVEQVKSRIRELIDKGLAERASVF